MIINKAAALKQELGKLSDLNQQLIEDNRELVAKLQLCTQLPHAMVILESIDQSYSPPRLVLRQSDQTFYTNYVPEDGKSINFDQIKRGQKILVNQQSGMAVKILDEFDSRGSLVLIERVLDETRVVVKTGSQQEVAFLAGPLLRKKLVSGDQVIMTAENLVVEKVESLKHIPLLEQPDTRWEDIGGLDEQIRQFRELIEIGFLFPEATHLFDLKESNGTLLTGPPGCGKTLIAKAAAHETAAYLSKERHQTIQGYNIFVNGPADILNHYVGDSEDNLKAVFAAGRQKAAEGHLVFIIFDEFETLFPHRHQQIADSGVHNSLVAQFNTEMDGMKPLDGVFVIATSNRPDLIDQAVRRPGRFGTELRIPRPNRKAALSIFLTHLSKRVQIHRDYRQKYGDNVLNHFAGEFVNRCYGQPNSPTQPLIKIGFQDHKEILNLPLDRFLSGAVIATVINNAKRLALRRYLDADKKKNEGLRVEDMLKVAPQALIQTIPIHGHDILEWLQGEAIPIHNVESVNVAPNLKQIVQAQFGTKN